jgi:hypothetical protein
MQMPTLVVKTTVTNADGDELFVAESNIEAQDDNDIPGLEIPRTCDFPIRVCAERKWLKFFAISVEKAPANADGQAADAGANAEEEKALSFKTVDSVEVEGPEIEFSDSVAFWGDSLKSMFNGEQNNIMAGILISNRRKTPVKITIFTAMDVMKKPACDRAGATARV